MSRTARPISPYGVYHVILRGVNRQQIFYDEEDYSAFSHILGHYKYVCGFRLYAYCLMGNHIHLLIRTGEEPLSTVFKRIGVAFVNWYNLKYERTGHLFQGRFKSDAVCSDRYFFTVLRYILQNPVKAGICKRPQDYPYSSAMEYFGARKGITDVRFALEFMGLQDFAAFLAAPNDDSCMEIEEAPRKRLTDAAAVELIRREFGAITPTAACTRNKEKFRASIKKLLSEGIGSRQLSRLTGISRNAIKNSLN